VLRLLFLDYRSWSFCVCALLTTFCLFHVTPAVLFGYLICRFVHCWFYLLLFCRFASVAFAHYGCRVLLICCSSLPTAVGALGCWLRCHAWLPFSVRYGPGDSPACYVTVVSVVSVHSDARSIPYHCTTTFATLSDLFYMTAIPTYYTLFLAHLPVPTIHLPFVDDYIYC